jgi:glycosyltransferase involved in cell wall biosynthesis
MPLVSVVIPAYNPGPFLASAVASVAAQTLKDWDIVVVDDGSIESIEELMRPFPFVRILHQQNQGQAMARNLGITQSVGKYVAFLDQDDLWVPRKLEHQILLFKENAEMPMCHTQFDLIDENGATRCAGFGRQQNYNELLEGSGTGGPFRFNF